MKKTFKILAIITVFSFGWQFSNAQIIVRVRPTTPHAVVGLRPSPRHVWVADEWSPGRSAYVYKGGHWETPPRDRAFYIKGHWRRSVGGWVWVPGHWK